MRIIITIISAGLVGSAAVFANQTFFRGIGLDQVVERSDIIAVVTRADPVYTVKEIPIEGKNIQEPGKPVPPYTLITYHFKLAEVITNRTGVKPAERLDVLEPNWRLEMGLHQQYYTENRTRSPLFESYDTGADIYAVSNKTEKLILFLRMDRRDSNWLFTVESAYDTVKVRDDVVRLMKTAKGE